ncbi:MAG: NTP transferase domain-containing protein [Phycisphaerae bacterium]|nr:NTP transferase domain-containing protein [Phycisphaerae bacterium]
MRYAVIMAGGSGKRLWPASREDKPKQLIKMIDDKCLLGVAMERLLGLFEPEQILVITNDAYAEDVRECLSSLPAQNVIGEPEGRDTANAIALAAELVAARDGDATMAIFTADHIIRPEDEFRQCVEQACQAAEENTDSLVTFGIRPTFPHVGLGYVHCDEKISDRVHRVRAFKEKPNHRTARYYVESGEYFWNSGMFVWKVGAIRNALKKFLPESIDALAPVGAAAAEGKDITGLLSEIYPKLPKISIDYAIMEKADDVLMVELTCQWLDVGSWPAIADVAEQDDDGNAIVAPRSVVLDCNQNVIFSDDEHLLAVVGMDDCIIVHTADATLVCNKSDSQRLKELVDLIEQKYGSEYI